MVLGEGGCRQQAGEREPFGGPLQDLGKGQKAGQALAVLPCLVFSARERQQLRQVPLLRRSRAASPGVCTEEAGGEAVLSPVPGTWPSIAGEQLVRRGPGGAGGRHAEHEPATCVGAKAARGVLGCMRRRWREGILGLHSALARPPLGCCVQCWAPQHGRDVGLLQRVQQSAAHSCRRDGEHVSSGESLRETGQFLLVLRRLGVGWGECLINVHPWLKGRHQEDGARLFSEVSSARTRDNGHQLKDGRLRLNIPKPFFHCEGDRALAQVGPGGCGVCVLGDVQKPCGHGAGQPARGDPA